MSTIGIEAEFRSSYAVKGSAMAMKQDDSKYQTGEPLGPEDVPPDVIVSSDTSRSERIPPGQSRTRKWPVLHYGQVPQISLDTWRLEIGGLVERPLSFSWEEFRALPRIKVFADFHCVTRWSRLGNYWEGVSVNTILDMAGVKPQAKFVVATVYDDGWTTNLPLADFRAEDALFADTHDDEPLVPDHGGPVRLIVPLLYAWKSAKWIKAIELTAENRPGLWERLGYHNHGDPWKEERYGW